MVRDAPLTKSIALCVEPARWAGMHPLDFVRRRAEPGKAIVGIVASPCTEGPTGDFESVRRRASRRRSFGAMCCAARLSNSFEGDGA